MWDIIADQLTGDERFARTFGLCPKLCAKGLPLKLVIASIHPDDSARVDKSIEEALQSSETYRCEYRVLHEDGIYRWIEASGRIERDSRGKPVRSPGVLLDIDSRRTAEDERDRLNELLRIFTAAVPGVVYAKDLEGRMLVANRGTADLIGKPPEFFIGKTDLDFWMTSNRRESSWKPTAGSCRTTSANRSKNRSTWLMALQQYGSRPKRPAR